MSTFGLLGVAAEAEGLRLRRTFTLAGRRAGWLAGAAVFGLAGLAFAHVAATLYLAAEHGTPIACAIVAGTDLALALVLAVVGRRLRDPVADEALLLRRTSLAAAAAESPLRQAVRLAGGQGAAPIVGAIAFGAVAEWLRRR